MAKYYEIEAFGTDAARVDIFGPIGGSLFEPGVTAETFAEDLKGIGSVGRIEVHINSPGGSVFEGLGIYNALISHDAEVNVIVDGMAFSMASMIAMAGDTVSMHEGSMMMIHDPRGMSDGTAEEHRQFADLLDKATELFVNAYERQTGKGRDEIMAAMDAETFFTAAEAAEFGLIDEVLEPTEKAIAATADANRFVIGQLPEQLTAAYARDNKTREDSMTVKTDNVNVDAGKSGDDVRAELIAQERQRKQDIEAAFGDFKAEHPLLFADCVADSDCTADQARAKLLEALGKKSEPIGSFVQVGEDESAKQREGIKSAILARAGVERLDPQNEFNGYSLFDVARHCVARSGIKATGSRMNIVGQAFTSTSDFPLILEDMANKALLKGFEESEETYNEWTSRASHSDFRDHSKVALSSFSNLTEVGEGGEFDQGSYQERGERYAVATYGKLFTLTRQAIINDDLSAFSRVPTGMGRAAARLIGDLAYQQLTSNPTMADGTAFFHADHNNLDQGGAGAPSVSAVAAMRNAMALQTDRTDSDGANSLNIRPAYLIVPWALYDTAQTLMAAEWNPDISTRTGKPNPVRGSMQVIADGRLDANSTTAWYMLASPAMYDTVELAFLDGQDEPYMEQQQGFDVDGIQWKVRLDVGAKPLEWRTSQKNSG